MSAVTHATRPAAPDAARLRDTLADHIARLGTFQTTQVETAFRTVPRHLFLPGTPIEDAYAPRVVVTRRADDGSALSSASSPNVVAAMLEQLQAQPGHYVLEIGTGTGINAAGQAGAVQDERHDQAPASRELLPPGARQVPCSGGGGDPVVRRAGGVTVRAVRAEDRDILLVSGSSEGAAGCLHDVVVDVDRSHVAAWCGDLGE